MKVCTPQILWNAEEDGKGVNAALMSVSLLQSGISRQHHVLATAGNSNLINLWKVVFDEDSNSNSSNKIDYLCSLSRHDGPVNAIAFSPDGLHLATAGDSGTVIVWSVPTHMRGNDNGRHFWSMTRREQDLTMRILTSTTSGEGVTDLSWGQDSKRFMAGSIDHSVFVVEDANYDVNHSSDSTKQQVDSSWRVVYRNGMDHTHYVQGVAYDPLGVYLSSMSSDRSVRVYPRKAPSKHKKVVLQRPNNNSTGNIPPASHQHAVQVCLTESKLELSRSKQVKFRNKQQTSSSSSDSANTNNRKQHYFCDESTLESFVRRLAWTADGAYLVTPAAVWNTTNTTNNNTNTEDDVVLAETNNSSSSSASAYATLMFARHKLDEPCRVLTGLEKPSIAVRPNPVLFQMPQQQPEEAKENQSPTDDLLSNNNNVDSSGTLQRQQGLEYRSIFCVLTWDSVLVYDTLHTQPLAVVRGLHYCNLVDATWSANGRHLVVCSTDGYISILSFDKDELGSPYIAPGVVVEEQQVQQQQQQQQQAGMDATTSLEMTTNNTQATKATTPSPPSSLPEPPSAHERLPPCEPGSASVVVAPPAKRARKDKVRIAPTLLVSAASPASGAMTTTTATATTSATKRPAAVEEEEDVVTGTSVDKLTIDEDGVAGNSTNATAAKQQQQQQQPKKKKRIQPILMAAP